MIRLRELENIDSHILYDAGLVTDSDHPAFLFVKVEHCEHWDSEWAKQGKYNVSIETAGPEWVSAEETARALQSCGMSREEFDKLTPLWQSRVLAEYGIRAVLWQRQGSNLRGLLKDARKELGLVEMLFGFYMDKPMNRIGNSGWDFIRGEIGFKTAGA